MWVAFWQGYTLVNTVLLLCKCNKQYTTISKFIWDEFCIYHFIVLLMTMKIVCMYCEALCIKMVFHFILLNTGTWKLIRGVELVSLIIVLQSVWVCSFYLFATDITRSNCKMTKKKKKQQLVANNMHLFEQLWKYTCMCFEIMWTR